jgi:hypothetical protein
MVDSLLYSLLEAVSKDGGLPTFRKNLRQFGESQNGESNIYFANLTLYLYFQADFSPFSQVESRCPFPLEWTSHVECRKIQLYCSR